MSEREEPSGSKLPAPDKEDIESQDSTKPMGSGSGGKSYYDNEPVKFRAKGSTTTGSSSPHLVSVEDIMRAVGGMQNMALAHEIAVDEDYKLEVFEPPDNSYQKLVKETMHKAYFDILREQLNSDPPEYKQALLLLGDVKQGLYSILLPRHTQIREMIEEALDEDYIEQQAKNNCLDIRKYANFVIDLMAKLAAPARDKMIQDITKLTDTVDIFRAILETLEVLKLDLANTLITMIRPHVQKESVNYERTKFEEMLKVTEDGLQHTREWLRRHIDKSDLNLPVTDINIIKKVTTRTLNSAYLELLEWNDSNSYPETVAMDAHRFNELSTQVYRVICVASIILVSPTCSDPSWRPEQKQDLRDKIFIIIGNAANDEELNAVLPSVAEEVILLTDRYLETLQKAPLDADTRELVKSQIISLKDPKHKVRALIRQRVLDFLKGHLVPLAGPNLPAALSTVSENLTSIMGSLYRYVTHNKAVFTQYYIDIITEELNKS